MTAEEKLVAAQFFREILVTSENGAPLFPTDRPTTVSTHSNSILVAWC